MKTGAGRTVACGTCHGSDLKGLARCRRSRDDRRVTRYGNYSICSRAPQGAVVGADEGGVEKLTIDDMIAIAAYTSSRSRRTKRIRQKPDTTGRAGRGWPASRTRARANRRTIC